VTVGAAVWKIHNPFHLAFAFLATLALGSNLQKVALKFQAGGLRGAGGYLAHVGVGVILLGILASSGYDESTKVTLEQGKPTQVGDLTLTFNRYVPRTENQRERMEVKVARADGKAYLAYPKLFMNDRTRQLMANPDVHNTLLKDLYISPIEYDPGQPHLELAKGKTGKIGGMEIRFVNFDLQVAGNAMAQMAAGKPVTIGANLEITQQGGTMQPLKALYKMNPADGRVETPPAPLPGGGQLVLAGINASSGAIQIQAEGVANPAKLSVDVTRKPLIILVWGGLYVVLIGGLLSVFQRIRELRVREQVGQIT
jgi:cytochrome c-type biogenesis protein CcmF